MRKTIGLIEVVMLDERSAVVSWIEESTIKAVIVHADGFRGPPILVAKTSDLRSSGFPQMARSNNNLLFAWTDDTEKSIKTAIIHLKPPDSQSFSPF